MSEPDSVDDVPTAARDDLAVVNLHIGMMKTGTSYLQRVLRRNTARLRALGVRYPHDLVGKAARDAIDIGARRGPTAGSWSALVNDLHGWDGPSAVASSELLSFASEEQAQRAVASLRPAQVEIIVTARDLVRLFPSAWQNKVKHGRSWNFPSFVEAVISDPTKDSGPARAFWHHHDLVEITRRWAAAAGPEHVTIVTLPPTGAAPDVLWQRFAAALDLEPGGFDTAQDQKSNLSLGYTEADLLRQVNQLVRDVVDKDAYHRHIRSYFANIVLRPDVDRAAVDKPLVPPAAHDWAIEKSHEMVTALRSSGMRVVGDLDELIPAPLAPSERAAAEAAHAPVIPPPVVRAVAELLLRLVELDAPRQGRRGKGSPRGAADKPVSTIDDDFDLEEF